MRKSIVPVLLALLLLSACEPRTKPWSSTERTVAAAVPYGLQSLR